MDGYDVEVADDAIWNGKTTEQFATYRAIVFGDSNFGDITNDGSCYFNV